MSNIKDCGAAFPCLNSDGQGSYGMFLRDYFAAKAMQALITSMHEHDISEYSDIAHDAYLAADAMLAERECGE